MSNADIRGRFVWHELMTTDTKAAGAFYSKVTAWRTQPWDKDPSYSLWVSGKGPFGGLRTLPDAARATGAHWLPYIGTPDVDATLQTAQRLGARVTMGATDIPDAGRMAVLADPQGAVFALYSTPAGSQSGGGSSSSMPQEFSWHELTTSDTAGALRFYGELFGWEEVGKHDMGPMGVYHLVGVHGVQSIGMFKTPPDKPMPTQWMCYAHVADVDKSANAAKAAGGKLMHGPMEVPGGTWIAQLADPQGAAFAVHADKRAAGATPAAQPPKVSASKSVSAPPAPKPQPPTVNAPSAQATSIPATSRPQVAATTSAPVKVPAASTPAVSKPTVSTPAAGKPAAKKAPAKKAAAKKAPAKKAAAKKAAKKKAPAKKRAQRKSKSKAKKATRRASAKRKTVKKRAKASRRRSAPGGLEAARRFAVKQADSLLKRLRGKKHR